MKRRTPPQLRPFRGCSIPTVTKRSSLVLRATSKERGVADEATLSLFVSDTEDEDFGGFSTQEEDEDEN